VVKTLPEKDGEKDGVQSKVAVVAVVAVSAVSARLEECQVSLYTYFATLKVIYRQHAPRRLAHVVGAALAPRDLGGVAGGVPVEHEEHETRRRVAGRVERM
jgi:hypothetical protein